MMIWRNICYPSIVLLMAVVVCVCSTKHAFIGAHVAPSFGVVIADRPTGSSLGFIEADK